MWTRRLCDILIDFSYPSGILTHTHGELLSASQNDTLIISRVRPQKKGVYSPCASHSSLSITQGAPRGDGLYYTTTISFGVFSLHNIISSNNVDKVSMLFYFLFKKI